MSIQQENYKILTETKKNIPKIINHILEHKVDGTIVIYGIALTEKQIIMKITRIILKTMKMLRMNS